jgi:hypothetical protein
MTDLVQHLEAHLGSICKGWSRGEDLEDQGFQVVSFEGAPVEDAAVFATLGVSNFPLRSRVSGKEIRQEFVFLAGRSFGVRNIPAVLQSIGREVIRTGDALLRGDVLGPRGPLFESSELEALYVAIPVYFPATFATCLTAEYAISLAWLVPITALEAEYVATHGWSAFEDRLVDDDPDLLDFERRGLRLC